MYKHIRNFVYSFCKKEIESNSYILELKIRNGGNEIMNDLPKCPKCNSEHTYEDRSLFVCPECAHEWNLESDTGNSEDKKIVKDANGNVLKDGDSITVIKDLKVKGSSSALKVGTKVKNIRLIDGDHNIGCKIDGFGAMELKSEFVKKI
jgi:protein PhnA